MDHQDHRPGRRRRAVALAAVVATGVSALAVPSGAQVRSGPPTWAHAGSFFITENLGDEPLETPTSAEIVDVTPDGKTAVYTDGLRGVVGFVDLSDPADPQALGTIEIDGDPTSLVIHRGWVLVATNTSEDFVDTSGDLVVVDLASRAIVRTIPLAGQPDSVALSPNGGRYAAIAIENERDEDVDGGLIPQLPAGMLQVLDLAGQPARWTVRDVDLTGLAEVAPSDPEPEYVDINGRDQAVVSLQENNHLVIVDLRRGRVINHFSAGTADITDVDTVEEGLGPQGNGLITLDGSLEDRRREPDTVQWIDDRRVATANEGDYEDEDGVEGGSRSFTIFDARTGEVTYESGNTFEHEIVRAGHHPEGRSENKGNEPEGLEVGRYRGRTLLFVASERANAVGAYDVTHGEPSLVQLLPTGIGPEGLTLTEDGVLVVTAEVDGADDGFAARPFITTYVPGVPTYPQLVSGDDAAGLPIPWVAMSGLAGDPHDANTLWAVSDSFLAQSYLYRIDVSATPARIVERIGVGGIDVEDQTQGDYDLEGVAVRPEGGFWLASEGRTTSGSSRPNLIVRLDGDGDVVRSVRLPEDLVAGATNSGLEGVAVTGTTGGGDEVVWVVIQREWADDASGEVKIGRYDVAAGEWSFARYPLDVPPAIEGAWVGLSELTALPDGRMAIVERDNQLGQEATIKRVYAIDPASVEFQLHGQQLGLLGKSLLRDIIGDLDAASISTPDKVEGLAVSPDGRVHLVTDNDGVDENYGETVFIDLGVVDEAFGG